VRSDQAQTADSFGFKWQQTETWDSQAMQRRAALWLVERYGFGDVDAMHAWFAKRRRILDAGCGSGFSAAILLGDTPAEYVGADISVAVHVAKKRFAGLPHTRFVQADMMMLPFAPASFDTVIAEGTLHHTPSTENALASVAAMLEPGGEILFYVYRVKAPAREFTDDHVRQVISSLPPEQAWAALRPLTALGRELAALHATITLDADIPYLGVRAGTYDVQRFLYNAFCKMFWDESLSFEENNHVNFDWFHPRYAHRQTEDEVSAWCERLGLRIIHRNIQDSGITIRALRN